MKASLNASVRDAQLRDSFNKESVYVEGITSAQMQLVQYLYKVQTQLPRNASKLHSLVVFGDNQLYVLNFEVLKGVTANETNYSDLVKLISPEKKSSKNKVEKEEVENDN